MSSSDLKELQELSGLAMSPYIDEIVAKHGDSYRKMYNTLSQKDRIYTEGMRKRVEDLCFLTMGVITEKINALPEGDLPRYADCIIANPNAYYKYLAETYAIQIKALDFMKAIFMVETPVDAEEVESEAFTITL